MRARAALLAVSTVVIVGGALGACGGGGEQADCATPAADVERAVSCGPIGDGDEPDLPDLPGVAFTEAADVPVGTRILLDEEDAELVVLDGPQHGFRQVAAGTYVAEVPGTYRVVPYVRVPCGGPPDEDAARTITVVDGDVDGDVDDVGLARPSGLVGPGQASAPRC